MPQKLLKFLVLVHFFSLICFCSKQPNNNKEAEKPVDSNSVSTDFFLEDVEEFWEFPSEMPKIVDSLSWINYPIESNEKIIRWRRLKIGKNNNDVYEICYYDESMNKLGNTNFLQFNPGNNTATEMRSTEVYSIIPPDSIQKILSKTSPTNLTNSCNFSWGYTDPGFHRGYFYVDKNQGGALLDWTQPCVPYTISRWGISISNLNSSPWFFNDCISCVVPAFNYRSIYCAEEDILKRRFIYTDAIGFWRHANFGNPMIWLTMNTPIEDGGFMLFVWHNPPYMIGGIYNLADCGWNDRISSLRVYISIDETTVGG